MSVHRDKERGTWRVALHIEDASGKLVNTTKRGFKTKSEALAWERNFLADVRETVDMTFEAFFEVYARDVKPRVRVTTWDQKEHLECQHLFRQFLDAQTCFPELNGGHVPERRVKSNGVVPMHVVVEL